MLKSASIKYLCLVVLLSVAPLQAEPKNTPLAGLQTDAMVIVKRFGGTLKPQLKKALQSGGPLHAIEICAERAPAIARQLSKKTGWTVKRVSLKPRNSQSALADNWETKVLQQFDQRRQSGESAAGMIYSEIVGGHFRFMKAQGVEPICLTCHGQNLAQEVKQALNKQYPDDQARGYSIGQIRGAFSLSKKL